MILRLAVQECDFITPTMRKLRGSILLSVQGHEKLWVFWKGTIVEPISFFEGQGGLFDLEG